MRAQLFYSLSLLSSLSYSSTSHAHTHNSTLRPFPSSSQVKYPPSLSVTLSLDWKSIYSDTPLLDKHSSFWTDDHLGNMHGQHSREEKRRQQKTASLTPRHFLSTPCSHLLNRSRPDSSYSSKSSPDQSSSLTLFRVFTQNSFPLKNRTNSHTTTVYNNTNKQQTTTNNNNNNNNQYKKAQHGQLNSPRGNH